MTFQQDLTATLAALFVCACLGSYGFIQHFKKTDRFKAPIIPWMIVSLACLATGFMLIVHLVNLMGLETGR